MAAVTPLKKSVCTKITCADMQSKTCFDLQVNSPSSLSTDRNQKLRSGGFQIWRVPFPPRSLSQTTAVEESDYNFSNAPKISRMLQFFTPGLPGSYDARGGTIVTDPQKREENLHYFVFLPEKDS
jgi:hypothetical protein